MNFLTMFAACFCALLLFSVCVAGLEEFQKFFQSRFEDSKKEAPAADPSETFKQKLFKKLQEQAEENEG